METYGTHPKWKAHIGKKVRTLCLICTSNYFYNIYIYTLLLSILMYTYVSCVYKISTCVCVYNNMIHYKYVCMILSLNLSSKVTILDGTTGMEAESSDFAAFL